MKQKILLFLVFAMGMSACKKKNEEPTACFSADKSFAKVGEIINFSNCSTNYTRVEWSFGDGGSSTISDPSYRYAVAGAYTVKLKTFNGVNWQEASKQIIASDNLQAHYDVSYTSSSLQSGDLVSSNVYYTKSNDSRYTSFGSAEDYYGHMRTQQGYSFAATGGNTYQIKLVVKVYRGYKSPQSMLPDILFAADSIVTGGIDPLSGTAISASEKSMSMITAAQSIYMTY